MTQVGTRFKHARTRPRSGPRPLEARCLVGRLLLRAEPVDCAWAGAEPGTGVTGAEEEASGGTKD